MSKSGLGEIKHAKIKEIKKIKDDWRLLHSTFYLLCNFVWPKVAARQQLCIVLVSAQQRTFELFYLFKGPPFGKDIRIMKIPFFFFNNMCLFSDVLYLLWLFFILQHCTVTLGRTCWHVINSFGRFDLSTEQCSLWV